MGLGMGSGAHIYLIYLRDSETHSTQGAFALHMPPCSLLNHWPSLVRDMKIPRKFVERAHFWSITNSPMEGGVRRIWRVSAITICSFEGMTELD